MEVLVAILIVVITFAWTTDWKEVRRTLVQCRDKEAD